MKNNFDWTLKDAFQQSNTLFHWKKEDRPPIYENHTLLNNGKQILVTSSGYSDAGNKATLRYSRTQSAVLDIATVMIYPTADTVVMPIFVAEWVSVQDNIHVIVLDVEWLEKSIEAEDFYAQNKNLVTQWENSFPPKKEKPDWFIEIASEMAIFSEAGIEKKGLLQKMFNEYLNAHLKYVEKKYTQLKFGPDNKLVQAYKQHHFIHSPARTIIKGEHEAWLNTFLKDYHFA